MSNPSRRNKRSCFVCRKVGGWFIQHSAKERFLALRSSRRICQFVTKIAGEEQNEDIEYVKLVGALEEVAVHMQEEEQDNDQQQNRRNFQ